MPCLHPYDKIYMYLSICIYRIYSSPPLIRTPLPPNNFVLIRELFFGMFGERAHYIDS